MKKQKQASRGPKRTRSRKDDRRFERRIPIEELVPRRTQREEAVELTVRGFYRGSVQMAADDGTAYICAKENTHGALYGDRVLAERIGRDRVIVARVLVHAHETIVGVLREREGQLVLAPMERRLPQAIDVVGPVEGAQPGDIVRTDVQRWEDEGSMAVRVIERIGSFDQAKYALEALVRSMRLRESFPPEAMEQAKACRGADLADDPQREDLRGLLSFTIDGRDAKDFDDAVSLEALPGGAWRLGVHIADVGHYVPQGSALDREAFLRGTSVYLPGRVIPMLPEELSNGVCSLRPDEDKFTLSALMDMDAQGEVTNLHLCRTITRSNARLVYDDVNALFDGDEAQRAACGAKHPQLCDTLLAMRDLARLIRQKRVDRGAIDFETSEPQFRLDENGEPVEIVKRERGEAEMMIEDFMLTANECVARWAKRRGIPLLYRVHEKPDPEKLATFSSFLAVLGVDARRITPNAKPGDIRAVLEATSERPEFRVISTLALRSMQKARYDAKPLGHYGLALEDYCHFTSPIRRYPDLIVSRAVTAALLGRGIPMAGERLDDAAQRSSDCERTAIEAERAADKLMMARMMASHVGEEFDGAVSGVTDFGVYVELDNGAEGFIHVRTLDDWFEYDERRMTLRGERTGAVFSLGQALHVRVASVELTQSMVDLELTAPLRPAKKEKSERKKERERMRGFHN